MLSPYLKSHAREGVRAVKQCDVEIGEMETASQRLTVSDPLVSGGVVCAGRVLG